MKSARQTKREARQLFHLCHANGALDEDRTRGVVQRVVAEDRSGTLPLLKRLYRLVALDRNRDRVIVKSATPLQADVRAQLESSVARAFGAGRSTSFAVDPALIGGVCVIVGSDVYDGSIRARLDALETRL